MKTHTHTTPMNPLAAARKAPAARPPAVPLPGALARLAIRLTMLATAALAALLAATVAAEGELEARPWSFGKQSMHGTLQAYDPERGYLVIKSPDPSRPVPAYYINPTAGLDSDSKEYLRHVPMEKIPAGTGFPASVDILGIRIGMTFEECVKTLKARGFSWTARGEHLTKSAAEEVRAAIAKARGERMADFKDVRKVATMLEAHRQEGPANAMRRDLVAIEFVEDVSAAPTVARAVRVKCCSILLNTTTAADGKWWQDARAMLVKKYGPAAIELGKDRLVWCSIADYRNGDRPMWDSKGWRRLEVSAQSLSQFTILLIEGDLLHSLADSRKSYIEEGKKKTGLPAPAVPKL